MAGVSYTRFGTKAVAIEVLELPAGTRNLPMIEGTGVV